LKGGSVARPVQAYETAVFDDENPRLALNLLTIPLPLGDAKMMSRLIESADWALPVDARAVIGSFVFPIEAVLEPEQARLPEIDSLRHELDRLLDVPVVPIENSPLEKQSLNSLIAAAPTALALVFAGGIPVVAVAGVTFGIVLIRPLWEGMRPYAVEFGGDLGEAVFDWLRERLGLPARKDQPRSRKPGPPKDSS
jgi:hypothetical protein